MNQTINRVSVHGGHSGQFCLHASNMLEEIVQAYIEQGFYWVGITEHMPPSLEELIYPEEKEAGLGVQALHERFAEFIGECRWLQKKYCEQITLYVGMETETYSGYERQALALINEFRPDYIVGSVHHVENMPIDYSREEYQQAAASLGGLDELYCRYFDEQYNVLQTLKPAVVGHFDLIRIFDDDYEERLGRPEIKQRIERNLDLVRHLGLILDYNLRALHKGAKEPYVCEAILAMARERRIAVVPGDDSHGVGSIGVYMDEAIRNLAERGFDTDWPRPVGW